MINFYFCNKNDKYARQLRSKHHKISKRSLLFPHNLPLTKTYSHCDIIASHMCISMCAQHLSHHLSLSLSFSLIFFFSYIPSV